MGTTYFFKNNTRREIIQTYLYDITKNLLEAINTYRWDLSDEIDIIDQFTDIQSLVEDEGYTIDYKCW